MKSAPYCNLKHTDWISTLNVDYGCCFLFTLRLKPFYAFKMSTGEVLLIVLNRSIKKCGCNERKTAARKSITIFSQLWLVTARAQRSTQDRMPFARQSMWYIKCVCYLYEIVVVLNKKKQREIFSTHPSHLGQQNNRQACNVSQLSMFLSMYNILIYIHKHVYGILTVTSISNAWALKTNTEGAILFIVNHIMLCM